ncbi:MAG: UDP-3-O-(3-hydroxymyristoyl)glucosamine N-acyltransferase [Gammaproteobacteria bacterium]|nr:UDP-3-O-(3-hydroxymyristoyl)glucosamine N-acyltransferase [Gammaproteobacteria bacterium]
MYTLDEIACHIEAVLIGNPSVPIHNIATLLNAQEGDLTHLSNPYYRGYLQETKASAVILASGHADQCPVNALIVDNPSLAYAKASQLFHRNETIPSDISTETDIHSTAQIGADVGIGPFVTIGPNVVLEERVKIGAHTSIGADSRLGKDTHIHSGVSIYDKVEIGQRCTIQANVVIGADGFGFIPDSDGKLQHIKQLGGVKIGNDVVVGASSTIDRGAIENTVIEDGVKLDDQVHIGHNCIVGAHSMLCGCTGLGGSVTIGSHCVFAGGVGIAGSGPLNIASGVTIGAMTYVSRSIDKSGTYQGATLHTPIESWRRNALRLTKLDELVQRVSELEKKLQEKQ